MSIGDRPLIVEMCGLPGAGKTTFCRALKQELTNRGIVAYDLADFLGNGPMPAWRRHAMRARFVAYGLLAAPRKQFTMIKLVWRDGQVSARSTSKVIWNFAVILGWYHWLRRHGDRSGIVLADQGLVQAAWSVRFSARESRVDWPAFVANLDVPDLFVAALRIDADIARERIVGRKDSPTRMSDYVSRHDLDQWVRAERILDDLISGLRAMIRPTTIVDIRSQASSTPEDLVQHLLPTILAMRNRN